MRRLGVAPALIDVASGRSGTIGDGPAPPGVPTVMHLVPEYLPFVRAQVDGPLFVHTVWETDRLPDHWPALLNQADGVIVPTQWNREIFVSSGVQVPVYVVPHVALEPDQVGLGQDGSKTSFTFPDISDEYAVFYTIGTWNERKVPGLVVDAFLRAFTARDAVALVVKTGATVDGAVPDGWGTGSSIASTTAGQVARLLRHHPDPPIVVLAVDEWDDDQIGVLHERGDCYATLTHGEGWGIGAFDACAHGNPVVATGWGGSLAYLEGSPLLVPFDLVPVQHSASTSYSPAQQWAEPRLGDAVGLLRGVAADLPRARADAAPLRARLMRRYAPSVVASQLLDVLGLSPSAS